MSEPGWLDRESKAIKRESSGWPNWMRPPNPEAEPLGRRIEIVFPETAIRSDEGVRMTHKVAVAGFVVNHPGFPAELRIHDREGVRRYKLVPIEEPPKCP